MQYPYQLVVFLDKEPSIGEDIYDGPNGWYPQVAIKRRFALNQITESELVTNLDEFTSDTAPFDIHIGDVKKPDHMPVEVIEVDPEPPIVDFHRHLIEFMGDTIVNKYPDREGANFYPHVTLEYWKRRLFDPSKYQNATVHVSAVWLVKDRDNSNEAVALKRFVL